MIPLTLGTDVMLVYLALNIVGAFGALVYLMITGRRKW